MFVGVASTEEKVLAGGVESSLEVMKMSWRMEYAEVNLKHLRVSPSVIIQEAGDSTFTSRIHEQNINGGEFVPTFTMDVSAYKTFRYVQRYLFYTLEYILSFIH